MERGLYQVNRSEVLKGTPIISSRWVNKMKIEADKSVRYKSKLVIRIFADRNGYDLRETYAPVARISDVRLIFASANKYNFKMSQLDVKIAFLNGNLEKEVYMQIPEGYN